MKSVNLFRLDQILAMLTYNTVCVVISKMTESFQENKVLLEN